MWKSIVLYVLVVLLQNVNGDTDNNMNRITQECCNMGSEFAKNHSEEDCTISQPVPSEIAHDLRYIYYICLMTRLLCCTSYIRKETQSNEVLPGQKPIQSQASPTTNLTVVPSTPAVPPFYVNLINPDEWNSQDKVFTQSTADYDTFDWTITKRIASLTTENFLLSPLGLKLALAIFNEAAVGATQSELSSVLGFGSERLQVREKYSPIIESLKNESSESILNLGSCIYVRENIQPRLRISAIAQEFYRTEIKSINFLNSSVASKEINRWVSTVTHGRLAEKVTEDDIRNMVILVLNTLYFKASWRHLLALNVTKTGPFFISPAKQKNTDFINFKDYLYYTQSSKYDAKILRIPYRSNNISMFFIVPNSLTGLSRVFNSLNDLRVELDNLSKVLVDVTLPRFRFDYTCQLDGVLKDLGVRHAFEDTASFPGIARLQQLEYRLKISKIVQRSGIEVNEMGSFVYSATGMPSINILSEITTNAYEVRADRPFLFFVEDEPTRQLLFTGRVSDPTLVDGTYKTTG